MSVTDAPKPRPTDGPIHTWFGLTYSNYLVLPRTLMQSMPVEWQQRMVACLDEIRDAFEHVPQAEVYEVHAATEHIVWEMTDEERQAAGVETVEVVEGGPVTFYRDGEEIDLNSRVLVTAEDPVPPYNRGRTYVEPRHA